MNVLNYKTCTDACKQLDVSCPNKECRNWINFEEDYNCVNICIEKNGPLTLREISKRVGCSFVRVKQIEEDVFKKIKKQKEDVDYL